jgi:hypothetical protein
MGADSAVHITTEGLDGVESLDSYSYARILAAYYAIRSMMPSFLASNLRTLTPDLPEVWWPNY